ncbi:diguanylate cyclase [Duganella sp. FT135W]|uniref:diguanylate cyclase n=1 Tax=Duganella flavida TaxID=2692175 RepID=A0A6L8KAC1_9BURK|nr:diguanylate cyclase [Duganella flavida]
MDIDKFKQVNDTYGHAVGDQVLQVTAARLSALFRNDDIVARWGSEEFLALLPTTEISDASSIAARVLDAVSAAPIVIDNLTLHVTISIGVCSMKLELKDRGMSWQEVVHIADQSLYLAKRNGRNKAYGIVDALSVTSAEMAHGLRTNHNEGKVKLLEVFGSALATPSTLQ